MPSAFRPRTRSDEVDGDTCTAAARSRLLWRASRWSSRMRPRSISSRSVMRWLLVFVMPQRDRRTAAVRGCGSVGCPRTGGPGWFTFPYQRSRNVNHPLRTTHYWPPFADPGRTMFAAATESTRRAARGRSESARCCTSCGVSQSSPSNRVASTLMTAQPFTETPSPDTTTTRTVVVIDRDLPRGLAANAAAVLALTLGVHRPSLVGPDFDDAD